MGIVNKYTRTVCPSGINPARRKKRRPAQPGGGKTACYFWSYCLTSTLFLSKSMKIWKA